MESHLRHQIAINARIMKIRARETLSGIHHQHIFFKRQFFFAREELTIILWTLKSFQSGNWGRNRTLYDELVMKSEGSVCVTHLQDPSGSCDA